MTGSRPVQRTSPRPIEAERVYALVHRQNGGMGPTCPQCRVVTFSRYQWNESTGLVDFTCWTCRSQFVLGAHGDFARVGDVT